MTDTEAYALHTKDKIWYNKFIVASLCGYNTGIGHIPRNGNYVVKPMMNLQGCGIGAQMGFFRKGDSIPENTFWSEVFEGRHITIDYSRIDGAWCQGSTFEGFKTDPKNLLQFSMWRRVSYPYKLLPIFDVIHANCCNIEIIGNKIIEVHLRHNTDPVQYDVFIPIWDCNQVCPSGFTRIEDSEDHPGRLGFFVPKNI